MTEDVGNQSEVLQEAPALSDDAPPPVTKHTFRKEVWEHLKKNKLCNFPGPSGRIPNFKAAHQAALRLINLEEFKVAKSVEVNPDKPLEPSRVLVLEHGKDLYVPVPRLHQGLLKKLVTQDGVPIQKLVSRRGIDNAGEKIELGTEVHIDLLVVGSVAVSKQGYRIGKGRGYADLEFALLKEIGAINDDTLIVTTVHESQVFDELPKDLFKKYDVPVDYILTPTDTIKIENRLPRPEGIYWDLLSKGQLGRIKILRDLRGRYEKEGKLQPVPHRRNRRNRRKSIDANPDADLLTDKTPNGDKINSRDKRYKKQGSYNVTGGERTSEENNENIPPSPRRKRHKYPIDFSLQVGNIARDVRVKDLKKALIEKGIKPDIITWKGYRGFCYLHYTARNNKRSESNREPFSIDKVIEILRGLKLNPDCKQDLTVKVMEPITRIETTDVTAV
ncbi:hypothetical protein NQ315_010769 [Exocentrus adspersus]|uniref:Methenyltetrahydrofolate synthase domain-containing protein n=1 Tax=Exocentrus adspersus TaxID=1586481 RepID=A0AAV8VVD6_9CUCU|nr:hypothetical protein NQ315_010769 [Exocentrus adspersus]